MFEEKHQYWRHKPCCKRVLAGHANKPAPVGINSFWENICTEQALSFPQLSMSFKFAASKPTSLKAKKATSRISSGLSLSAYAISDLPSWPCSLSSCT
jgi:hypothetical protein